MPCAVSTATTSFSKESPSHWTSSTSPSLSASKAKIMPRVGPGGADEETVLRRLLVWNETGFSLQPDQKHFQNLAELLEVGGVKPASTPTSKRTGRTLRDALERQSGGHPKQKVHWDLHVPRTRRVRRAVHGEGPHVRYAGADAVGHGKVATTGSIPLRHASHRHVPHEPGGSTIVWTDGGRSGDEHWTAVSLQVQSPLH